MKALEDPLISILLILFLLVFPVSVNASSFYNIPESITVRVTGEKECPKNPHYVLQQINFKEYVKGVLPNEWGSTWNEESLKAGAVAVKMYAWSMYSVRGFVWDCTWSQVYDPRVVSEKTDQAVDDTWDYYLIADEKPVRTFFNAWINGCYIQEEENCMGQWNSLADAESGMTWQEILEKYYEGELVCPNCENISPQLKKPIYNPLGLTSRFYTLYQFEFHR
jgi:peptidoglycan hydrolase-like amidase